MSAAIRLSWLDEQVGALERPKGVVVALLDADGSIFMRHPRSGAEAAGSKLTAATHALGENTNARTDLEMLDGVRRMVALERLGDMILLVAAGPSLLWDQVLGTVRLQVANFALIVLLTALGAIAAAYWMVVQPLRQLEHTVDAHASGDRSARAVPALRDRSEVGRLARCRS